MENPVKLTPSFIYGFTSNIKGGAHFIDDETIVYPIGRVLCFHKIGDNTEKYAKVNSAYKINTITISPNRKVVAVAISGPKPAISIYSTNTLERIITIGNPAEGFKAKLFEHLTFTNDSVYLVAVTSDPEGLLIYYKWETAGIVAFTKADGKPNSTTSGISIIAPHPKNPAILAIGGMGVFRLMTLYYNELKQFGFKRAEYWPISSMCWITLELLLIGTRDGRLMVIEETLMKAEFKVKDTADIRISEKEDYRKPNVSDAEVSKMDKESNLEVKGLISFSQGFAFAFNSGEVVVFKKVDKRHWVKKNVILTGAPSFWEEQNAKVNYIKFIDISPTEHKLLCTSGAAEVYYTNIFLEQDAKFKIKPQFEVVHNGFHYGPVASISTCLYKPFFLSVGTFDNTCRIWNFETLKLINILTFSEAILTAAFHPTGLYCIIAFEKDIKVFMVLMDCMKPITTLEVKHSMTVCYSKRGNVFACVNNLNISVFGCVTFEKLWEFRNMGNVTSLHFSAGDFVLYTGGLNGIVCKYCLKTGTLLMSLEINNNVVHSITSSNDGNILYVVGADGCLKVYQTNSKSDDKLIASHNLKQSVLNSVTLASDDGVLLVGGHSTNVAVVRTPVGSDEIYMQVYKLHSSPITQLQITHVNPTLLSLGKDGVITIWKLESLQKNRTFLKSYREIDEVIVNSENWSNKRTVIKTQQELMNRLDRAYDNKLERIEVERMEEEAKICGRYQGVLDIIGLNNKITQEKNLAQIRKITLQRENMIAYYDHELDTQRVKFEQRLRAEHDDLQKWRCGWGNMKYGFDQLINSVKFASQCVAKRLEYFSAMELTRRVNETLSLRDDILQIIEEQKNRELNLIKHSQFEIDDMVTNSERHEKLAAEILELRNKKQTLCDQVEGLENTYFNMQEFLREADKTISALDHRKSQRKVVDSKQKKITEKIESIRVNGRDILDNIEMSKAFRIHHLVSEECIESLCQINHLLEARKSFKRKEQWLRQELMDSNRTLNRMRYVLSFMCLQQYLHNNALQRSISRKRDKNRKINFFRTNLKKEIHTITCALDTGNFKGRLINLCAQYADPKVDYFELLDKLSANRELWKGITHLETTKLHIGNCVRRSKKSKKDNNLEDTARDYVHAYDDDCDDLNADDDDVSASTEGKRDSPTNKRKNNNSKATGKEIDETDKNKESNIDSSSENSSTEDFYHTSDEESSFCAQPVEGGMKKTPDKIDPEMTPSTPRQPISIILSKSKTSSTRNRYFGKLLEEKKMLIRRLLDVRKRMGLLKKIGKYENSSGSDKWASKNMSRKNDSKTTMDAIIKAVNLETESLSKAPVCQILANELFPKLSLQSDHIVANSGHLCSLCKSFDMFTKHFENKDEPEFKNVVAARMSSVMK